MRVTRVSSAIIASLGIAAFTMPAAYAAADLVDDFREVFTLGSADDGIGFADWNESEAPAMIHTPFLGGVIGEGDTDGAYSNGSSFLDSSVTADKFWGFGYTDGFAAIGAGAGGDADAFSQSVFDVGFTLSGAHNYTIEGEIFALRAMYDYASVGILDLNTFLMVEEWSTDGDGNIGFGAVGVLDEGFYAMVGFAETFISIDQGFASGEAWYTFELELQAVPLPAAVWLFGAALLGLLPARRRKR